MRQRGESSLIQVEIFGQAYNVRGEEDHGYIEELARYVDAKMKAVSETTGTIDSLKVAILAALNIADELFKLEREHREVEKKVAVKANELASALDEALGGDPDGSSGPSETVSSEAPS